MLNALCRDIFNIPMANQAGDYHARTYSKRKEKTRHEEQKEKVMATRKKTEKQKAATRISKDIKSEKAKGTKQSRSIAIASSKERARKKKK